MSEKNQKIKTKSGTNKKIGKNPIKTKEKSAPVIQKGELSPKTKKFGNNIFNLILIFFD